MSSRSKSRGYQDELRRKKKRRLVLRLTSIFLIVVLIAASAVYLLFFAGYFEIKKVNSSVAEGISETEIGQSINSWLDRSFWGIRRRDNSLLVSFDEVENLLAKQFPKIESVEFSKDSLQEISVSIISRKPEGIWCLSAKNKCFFFDRAGVAYAETGPSNGAIFTNVDDRRDREVELGRKIAPDDWLSSIITARKLLLESGFNALEFVIGSGSFDEFEAKTEQGWKIFFSNSTDIAGQIRAMLILLDQKLSGDQKSNLQYIDLRIQDRIYYK